MDARIPSASAPRIASCSQRTFLSSWICARDVALRAYGHATSPETTSASTPAIAVNRNPVLCGRGVLFLATGVQRNLCAVDAACDIPVLFERHALDALAD